MHTNDPLKIALGDLCIELNCSDLEFMADMRIKYAPFTSSRLPDFVIILSLTNRFHVSEIKDLLHTSRSYIDGNRYYARPALFDCLIDWEKANLHITVEKELFSPEADYKLMNILLRGIYAGVYRRIKKTSPEAYLVHGCGIASGESCYLFTGPSGSGKTTVASLADGRKILNDEAVLIKKNREGFYLSGTPIDGGVSSKCGDTAHLTSIFFLKQDTDVSLRRLTKVEIYKRFFTEMFDTSPLFESTGLKYLSEQVDFTMEVTARVPSYELAFRPDTSFWQAIRTI